MSTVPDRCRVPLGALGALILLALVEVSLGGAPLRFADPASLSWRLSLAAAEGAPGSTCQVACLGDSLVKIGVLPRVIEATTGQAAYNFAMGRAPAPATYFLLRRLLANGSRPRTIVVDFKPSILAGGPKFNLREWQAVLRPSEAVELANTAGGVRFLVEIALGRLLPSWRGRWEIREAIAAALANRVAPTYRNNRLALRNWGINAGTHLNGSQACFDGQIAEESRRKLVIPRWECHRANAIYVEKFLALAAAHGVAVVWLIAPSSPELQALREQTGGDAAFAAFVQAAQRRHPTLSVVDGRHSGYATATFADATHLNGRGAATLSHELALLLTHPADLAGKWVALPPFRTWDLGVSAEAIERSTAIIDAELLRR